LGSLAPGKEASFIVFDFRSPNLTYQQDVISALVHRATLSDIAGLYVKGEAVVT
jgi:cytosine/adenosine deaminase-related metal-dependent hydrolase